MCTRLEIRVRLGGGGLAHNLAAGLKLVAVVLLACLKQSILLMMIWIMKIK